MRRASPVLPTATAILIASCVLFAAPRAYAFEPFAFLVPCRATATNSVGTVRPCITCHNNPDGGSGCSMPPCFNPFGMAFNGNGRMWNETLADMDSDGDGYTNGEELGDPEGDWRPAMGLPSDAICNCATRPGLDTFTPGDTDADMDRYCCRGQDTNMDGDCTDPGEHEMDDVRWDCNEMDATVNSGMAELCTNTIDNDCDGLPTLMDTDCAGVVDRDGDGYCPTGRDTNRDRDCIDSGEITSDMDCDDTQITVFPGNRENCADGLDNDCNDDVDTADAMCTSDTDADVDGFCPIGRDINGNGNCNDPGEIDAGIDCDDTNASVNPLETESCTDGVDNDCNGLADRLDASVCNAVYDEDGDGYCPMGRDIDADGDCADAAEGPPEPGDCDDADPLVSPGDAEVCEDDIDNDCDTMVSLDDPDCAGYLDTDGDRYCFVGFDMDRDGQCLGDEVTGAGDCDDGDATLNPAIAEVCTDALDTACDGVADSADRNDCELYRDHDLDGWCLVGHDENDDGDCDDAGEQGGDTEVAGDASNPLGTDLDPTVYPGAPENCLDRVDNDLDGVVDNPDRCTRDMDADGDGYCPIGQDLNADGDCLDDDENRAVSDCNEMDAEINPGAEEMCREIVDTDCDGDWGKDDDDCVYLLDRDHDGFCGMGVDDNGDGDCDDETEDRFGMDCDDRDPAVNARAREVCDDTIDNDCDGAIDYVDTQCVCETAAMCDDGDPCTRESCSSGMCSWTPDATCGDGGMGDGGVVTPPSGCGCRTAGTPSPAHLGWLLVVALAFVRRRRR